MCKRIEHVRIRSRLIRVCLVVGLLAAPVQFGTADGGSVVAVFQGVGVWAIARQSRGATEPDTSRDWWRLTERPSMSALAALLAGLATVSMIVYGAHWGATGELILRSCVGAALTALFIVSAVGLRRHRPSPSDGG